MKLPVFRQARKSKTYANAQNIARALHKRFYGDIMPRQMYCPYCGYRIDATTRQERLETLSEHVTNPNGTPSLKTVYKCTCPESKYTMWNYAGEAYYDFPENYDKLSEEEQDELWYHREAEKHFGKDGYNLEGWSKDAINSIAYSSHNDVYNPGKKKHLEFKFGKAPKYIPRIVWNFAYDNFGKVISCKPTLEYCVRDDSHGKVKNPTYFIKPSLSRQIKWRIDDTKRDYKKWKANPSLKNLMRLYGYRTRYNTPNNKDVVTKFWYTKVIPLIFGRGLGIGYKHNEDNWKYVK